MTPPPSSPSGTPKRIFWLFLDPVNPKATCNDIELSDHDWVNMTMSMFIGQKLFPEMQKWFSFNSKLSTLEFWSPSEPLPLDDTDATPGWVENNAPNFDPMNIAKPLSKATRTVNCFLGGGEPLKELPENLVHFIVTAGRKERQQEHRIERDTLPDLVSKMHESYHAIIEGRDIPSPSTAAEFGQRAKLQTNPKTAVYDGFYDIRHPADTSALPIEVYHPVFQQFTKDITTAKPSRELLIKVQGLMRASTGIGTVGLPLAENLRSALAGILRKCVEQVIVSDAIPGGVVLKSFGEFSVPLLAMEHKCEIGEGGRDPMTQASYYILKYWQEERVRNKCCCPTFIIAGSGPYLSIIGAIITDKYIVQRLTSGLEWLGLARAFEEGRVYRIAQAFEALRRAVEGLEKFYDEISKQGLKLVDGKPHPRFYPHITKFTDSISGTAEEFEYLRQLTPSSKSPFLVKLKSSGNMAVVKFVERYGAGAHRLLAEAKMAPRLLFCGSIDGQHKIENMDTKCVFGLHLQSPRMVVMEYIEGTHGEALMAKPKDTYAQVKAMVEKLHDSGYVFGDLRPPNVVFATSKAFLVDFDWAGKHGEAFYPMELGEGITKYCKGRDLEIIEKEHDLALLDHYFLWE